MSEENLQLSDEELKRLSEILPLISKKEIVYWRKEGKIIKNKRAICNLIEEVIRNRKHNFEFDTEETREGWMQNRLYLLKSCAILESKWVSMGEKSRDEYILTLMEYTYL